MGRRVALFLSSILAVVVLASAGWLLDPAGSRRPAGPEPIVQVRPETTGPTLYAAVFRQVLAEGTATYTFSGSSGGAATQSGTGALRLVPADGASLTGDPALDADVTLTSTNTGRVRAILLPGAFYLALPPAKGLPKNKPWLKIAQAPRTALGRQLLPLVQQMSAAFDPAQVLGLIRSADRVIDLGPSPVEGKPAVLHRATVDLRRAAAAVGDPGLKAQYQAMVAAGVRTLQVDLWLDSRSLPGRMQVTVPATVGVYSMTGVFRGWGEKVSIAAPTAKQVFDSDAIKG